MILYTNGCSWTTGEELEHIPEYAAWRQQHPEDYMQDFYNQYNWSRVLAEQLNATEFINQSIGGGSNNRMIRTTLDFIKKFPRSRINELIVVLGWTSCERGEIYIDDQRLAGWHRFNMTQPFEDYIYHYERDGVKDIIAQVTEYQKHYTVIGNSYIGNVEKFFNQQWMMKNTLENLGIKYLFFQAVPAWWDTWMQEMGIDVYKKHEKDLDLTVHDNNIGTNPIMSMQTQCALNGFPHGPHHHVLKEGHEFWAKEVLYPRIKELYGI